MKTTRRIISIFLFTLGGTACVVAPESEFDEPVTHTIQPLAAACGPEFTNMQVTPWPGGVIPYKFTGNWSNADKTLVTDAMEIWEVATGGIISFYENPSAPSRMELPVNSLCESGRGWSSGVVTTSLNTCGFEARVHELGHAIGLSHQGQRFDRDRYLLVDDETACDPSPSFISAHCDIPFCGYENREAYVSQLIGDNITKSANGNGTDYGPFDQLSIMRYPSTTPNPCAALGQTGIRCINLRRDGTKLTQNPSVSLGDASSVIEMYREPEGWRRFKPVYRADPGPTTPLDTRLTSSVTMTGSPGLTRFGSGLAAVMRGSNLHYYVKTNSNGSQSGWASGNWTDIGGDFSSDPAIVSWGSGRLDVVGVGADGAIWHKSHSSGVWESGWRSLGRPSSSVTPSAPAIASWGTDRLDIFVRSGTELHQKSWTTSGWSGWSNRGCCITGKPSAVSWGTNRIDVVATGTDGAVWHTRYNGSWGGWTSILGDVFSGTSPAIASEGSPDQLNVYVKGSNGRLWHKTWGPGGWSVWRDIGGRIDGSPAAATATSGRAHVVGKMNNGAHWGIWHKFWQ